MVTVAASFRTRVTVTITVTWSQPLSKLQNSRHSPITVTWSQRGVTVTVIVCDMVTGHAMRSMRSMLWGFQSVMLGNFSETLAVMYLQRGPPISKNKSTVDQAWTA
jgi:hypothetical protein